MFTNFCWKKYIGNILVGFSYAVTLQCPVDSPGCCALLNGLDTLDNNRCGCTTAVADGGNTILARLELVKQSCENPGPGAAQRMA